MIWVCLCVILFVFVCLVLGSFGQFSCANDLHSEMVGGERDLMGWNLVCRDAFSSTDQLGSTNTECSQGAYSNS